MKLYEIGQKIRILREEKKLTQEELANIYKQAKKIGIKNIRKGQFDIGSDDSKDTMQKVLEEIIGEIEKISQKIKEKELQTAKINADRKVEEIKSMLIELNKLEQETQDQNTEVNLEEIKTSIKKG